MSFISYAQNFEDVMLWRALKHIEAGFYIDVGANDPEIDSVTRAFYERGWRGINIEPISQWFERLQVSRPRDINLQLAIGSQEGELTLFEIPDTGLSTARKSIAEQHKAERGYKIQTRKVRLDTLTSLCDRYHTSNIHFIKIDVEGMEKAVLTGTDFTRIRPWIVLVESTLPNSQKESHAEWEFLLLEGGYQYAYCDGLNRFYVADERSELLRAFQIPPNVFDDFVLKRHLDAEKKAHDAYNRAHAAEAKVEEYEEQILATNERITKAEARAEEAERNADEAVIRLREVQSRADRAIAKSIEAGSQGENAEIRADRAEAELQMAESRTQEYKRLVERLQCDIEYAKTQSAQIREKLRIQGQELSTKQTELEELNVHGQWLQDGWDAAKTKMDELNQLSLHWWSVAEGRNRELQAIYRSKFWRLTRPLRVLMQWLKGVFFILITAFKGLLKLPRKSVHWLLTKLIHFILRRPRLKKRIKTWLYRHRELEAHLRTFSRSHKIIQKSALKSQVVTDKRGGESHMTNPSNHSTGGQLEVEELMRRIHKELDKG